MEAKVLMSVNEFCRQYSMSRSTFYNEVADGKLRIVKRGRRTLITHPDREAYLEALRGRSDSK